MTTKMSLELTNVQLWQGNTYFKITYGEKVAEKGEKVKKNPKNMNTQH